MKYFLYLFLFGFVLTSCKQEQEYSSIDPINWEKRMLNSFKPESTFENGETYLSVYSEIYSLSEHRTHDLTATISLRNISPVDSVYIHSAIYYDTHGNRIRSYFENPIYLLPFETVEIVIDEADETGGTGGNFHFQWSKKLNVPAPLFEAVMISTSGQQGVSFVTVGKKIN